MPNNAYFNVPFIPQEGITQQILQAIGMADTENQRKTENEQRDMKGGGDEGSEIS